MIRVLVVDDEPIAAAAHAEYLGRLDGYELAAIAYTAREAYDVVMAARTSSAPIDLLLLDLTLPDASGVDLVRALRTAQIDVDFIAITAVRQVDVLHAALGVGAIHYLVKPFGFAAFRDKLQHYSRYHHHRGESAHSVTQQGIDELLAARRPTTQSPLPKGLSTVTLDAVSAYLRQSGKALSASETADHLSLSRVTARRYLEHLSHLGMTKRTQRYGAPGRPEIAYSWNV